MLPIRITSRTVSLSYGRSFDSCLTLKQSRYIPSPQDIPSRRPAAPLARDSLTLPDMLNLLFFPPPTRFLNARPGKPGSANLGSDQLGSSAPDAPEGTTQPTDAANDEYICCFCEYDLFFGSAASLDKGIRR